MVASIVHPYCQKVMPLTYDNSLSYYEQLCKLTSKMNEIVDVLNGYDEAIAELRQAIVDIDTMKTNIAELQEGVISLQNAITSINDIIDTINSRLDDAESSISNLVNLVANINNDIDSKIEALRKELTNLFNSFTDNFTEELQLLQLKVNQMKVNMQFQIDELNRRVDSIDTSVINPWHTELGKVSVAKNNQLVYRDLSDNTPTASDYCKMNLSAEDYSKLDITAMEYAQNGKSKIHLDWVFSPAYGFLQEINNVLTSILNFVYDTYTADAYSELDLTSDEYADLSYSADDYLKANYSGGGGGSGDTRGFIKYDISNSGLTRREFEHLGISQS